MAQINPQPVVSSPPTPGGQGCCSDGAAEEPKDKVESGETLDPTLARPKPQSETKTLANGLKVTDEVVGTGATPKKGDTVTVNYTGTLTNGTKFDSSFDHGKPFSFKIGVGQVIPGWDEGVMSMQVGGKRKLVIPPDLAYGNEGVGGVIPPDSTLVFEVELLDVKSP